MTRRITPQTTLDNLKKEAKRWLKELHANDRKALERLIRAYPKAPAKPVLRDVQHALAVEYGLPGWTALKQALENRPAAEVRTDDTQARLISRFLEYACPDHHVRGRPAHRMARHAAMRILQQHPEIARDSLYTAVVCGELEEVERILQESPELASAKSSATAPDRSDVGGAEDIFRDIGSKGWEPLLYLCFTRLPLGKANDNALAMARLLLDHGADPNVYFMAGDSRYTPLVGVIGEGEEARPPHPQREALTRLLLERGAEPYDGQVVYNIHFHGKILWYMKLMHEFSVKAGRNADWDEPEWHMLDQGDYGSGARWHLWIAVQHNDLELAEWCLAHGASPMAAPPRDQRFSQRSLYEEAVRAGHTDMAELLARHDAVGTEVVLERVDAFIAACLRRDRVEAERLLERNPEYLRSREAMLAVVRGDRADIVQFLLDLGLPADIEYEQKQRPLHLAANRLAAAAGEAGSNEGGAPASEEVARLERLANDMVTAYSDGDAAAMLRINEHYGRSSTVEDLRATVWRRVYKVRQARGAAHAFGIPEAQELIARTSGFPNWTALTEAVAKGAPPPVPPYVIDAKENRISPPRDVTDKEWDTIIGVMKERRIPALEANGFMTDGALKRIAELDFVTSLRLGGSRRLSDEGLLHLAPMPQLQELNLSEHPGGKLTDRGLEVLCHLPNLRTFEMTWQRGISDAGVGNLRHCNELESVNLMGTPTGNGAIEALRAKHKLRRFQTGRLVTDAGLPLLHDFPMLKTWHGGDIDSGSKEAIDNAAHLLIDGPFTNKGLAGLAGLDGVYELDLFWHVTGITSDGFAYLVQLPNLGSLGCDGELSNDEAMRHIGAMPRLRRLRAQESVATDNGFTALSRSKTIEFIWGRECPNFASRGFVALSKMPALRGIGLGCRNVDDAALSTLPDFPALRELTPIGVKDDGFRHVGRCARLERLTCMYCRDTTDTATEHIAGLRLKYYYAGLTQITDRSLEILGRMTTLETVDFFETKGVTDAGLAHLAKLPRLREVNLSGLPNITLQGTKVFPAHVRVNYEV